MVVRIVQGFGDLADGESEAQQFLDSWQIRIKFAFLNSSLGFSKRDSLTFFGGQRLPALIADDLTFPWNHQRYLLLSRQPQNRKGSRFYVR